LQGAGVRAAAAGALQQIGPAAAAGVVEALGKDRDHRVRAAAAAALPGLAARGDAHRQVRDALLAALEDHDEKVRAAARAALNKIDPEAAKKKGR
jgi:HEAT repeat protein